MSAARAHTSDAVPPELSRLVEPVVTAAGYDLEELVVRRAGQRSVVRVVVDSDEGVPLDAAAEISRALSEALDAEEGDLGRAPYVLEVTSPGVDRPLTQPRHWRRNAGRLVTVEVGGQQLTARVVSVSGGGVTLDVQRGGGKGRVAKSAGQRTLGWAELGPGQVQVEFSRPAGHRDAGLVVEAGPDEHDDDHDDDHDDEDHDDTGDDDDLAHHPDDAPAGAPGTHGDHGPQDHRASGSRDDASRGARRPGTDRRRAPAAPRPPRGGRQ